VLAYLRGLLGQLERKNGWTLAEAAGEVSPDGMQRLLRTADWNADAVRDQLRAYVVERLGCGGVLIVDETGFIEKGSRSAGGVGSTPAPPARSTTASSGSSWPTPPRPGGR
jgi:SRSO17 transposase